MTEEQQESLNGARTQQLRDKQNIEDFIRSLMNLGSSEEEAVEIVEKNLNDLSRQSARRIREQQREENGVTTPDSNANPIDAGNSSSNARNPRDIRALEIIRRLISTSRNTTRSVGTSNRSSLRR